MKNFSWSKMKLIIIDSLFKLRDISLSRGFKYFIIWKYAHEAISYDWQIFNKCWLISSFFFLQNCWNCSCYMIDLTSCFSLWIYLTYLLLLTWKCQEAQQVPSDQIVFKNCWWWSYSSDWKNLSMKSCGHPNETHHPLNNTHRFLCL